MPRFFRKKQKLALVACPYCGCVLEEKPTRKKKCPECGKPIYVRTLPSTREKVLVTESRASEIEEEWGRIHWRNRWFGDLASLGITEEEIAATRKKAPYRINDADLVWSLLNKAAHESARNQDFHRLKRANYSMALFLDEEGRDFRHVLAEAAKSELWYYRQQGVKAVRILTAGESSCEVCREHDGKVYSIAEALQQMPIPVPGCTHRMTGPAGFCRCTYVVASNREGEHNGQL